MRQKLVAALTAGLLTGGVAVPRAHAAPDTRGTQAAQLFQQGKYREAAELYVQLRDEKQDPKYLCNLGVCYYKMGHLEPAIETVKQCLDRATLSPQTRQYYQDLVPKLEAQRQSNAPVAPADVQLVPPPEASPMYPPAATAPVAAPPMAWPAPPGAPTPDAPATAPLPPAPTQIPPAYPEAAAQYPYQQYPGYPQYPQAPASYPAQPPAPAVVDKRPKTVPFGSYVTGAVGVVSMGMGVAFVLHGMALTQELESSTKRAADREILEADRSRNKNATIAAFAIGAAGIGAAVIWALVAPSRVGPALGSKDGVRVAVGPGAVGVTGKF